jgi:hypothetical protein
MLSNRKNKEIGQKKEMISKNMQPFAIVLEEKSKRHLLVSTDKMLNVKNTAIKEGDSVTLQGPGRERLRGILTIMGK